MPHYTASLASCASPPIRTVPEAIDQEFARLKLLSPNVQIDTLTDEQTRDLCSWQEGT